MILNIVAVSSSITENNEQKWENNWSEVRTARRLIDVDMPPALGKSRISRNSEVPGLPGCHSEGEENRRSEEPTGQSPSGAGTWVQPPDPVDSSRRENERKPENPRDGRISARIPPLDAPFAPAGSPARVWLKSGLGSARRRAKLALREKGQGSPPAALKSCTFRGSRVFHPEELRT